MRSEVEIVGSQVIKRVTATSHVADLTNKQMDSYQDWLASAGIESVDTQIDYQDGKLIFIQPHLKVQQYANPARLIGAFLKLDYSHFGMDSNPGNFMGESDPVNVDFYPFLIRDRQALVDQFDYPVNIAIERYFIPVNVVTTYVVRLFKIAEDLAKMGVESAAPILLEGFKKVLPREKLRLLNALTMMDSGSLEDFPDYYVRSKSLTSISTYNENSLMTKLANMIK